MNNSKINFAYFTLLACFWSGSFIGIKAAVTYWPPIFSAAMRLIIALVCIMTLLFLLRKDTRVPLQLRWKIWVIGFFSQGLPFSFLFWGEKVISPGLAGILNGTMPIWTFVLALIFQLTNFSLLKLMGLVVGILGVIFVFWPLLVIDNSTTTLLSAAAMLATALCYSIGGVLNQHFLRGKTPIDFLTNIYHQHWASTVYLVAASCYFEKWPSIHSVFAISTPWFACLYLGVFSTAIAYLIYYHLIRTWDAVRASTVLYITPILALVWDYLFYGTIPQVHEIGGTLAILVGVILIQLSRDKQTLKTEVNTRFGLTSPVNSASRSE